MRKTKMFISVILLICTMSMMTGCEVFDKLTMSTDTRAILDLDTTDRVQLKVVSQQQRTVHTNDDTDTVVIKNKEKETILTCRFVDETEMEKWLDDNEIDLELVKKDVSDTTEYALCKFKEKSGASTYYVIGWITGSNTGYIAEGTRYIETIKELVIEMQFAIKKTYQEDKSYVFDGLYSF